MPGGQLFFYDCKSPTSQEPAEQKPAGLLPALVFIHGLGDEADTWRHIIPLLCSQGYRCIVPDLPGFGRSQWRGRISVSRHANAVLRLMTECGVDSPVVLIGSSMGCGVAELVAFRRPDLVQAMIFLDGCFPINDSVSKEMILLGLLPFIGRRWYRSFRLNHEAAWKSLYAYYHDLDAMSDEDKKFLRERVIARVESTNQERGYFASLRSINAAFMFGRTYFTRKIKKFKGKIFLLWGEHDRVMPVENAAIFRELRPDALLKTISGAGHLPHQENPAETVEAILPLLKSPF
jgi:pimeloyl-ACP methyl ester carboxylesterase